MAESECRQTGREGGVCTRQGTHLEQAFPAYCSAVSTSFWSTQSTLMRLLIRETECMWSVALIKCVCIEKCTI